MLDTRLRALVDPFLQRLARRLVARGVSADQVTIAGFACSMAGVGCIAVGAHGPALALLLAGRIGDGLDGAVAGLTRRTDRGGFLDISLDFVVYAAVPLAFAWQDPAAHALAAAALLASFLANGTAFLAFAVMAERRGMATADKPGKSLPFLSGLAEGSETIAFFAAFCIWPQAFAALALTFAALCALSAAGRVALAWRLLSQ
jgi:phosphatidylglycerophosphate synthase